MIKVKSKSKRKGNMCMKKRIATTSMVIVLLVCCVGVSNTKADDNNEYGILSNSCEFALATMNAILVKINANLPF